MNFRQLVKRLHPDSIGNHSKVIEFTELMKQRRNECLCGCGRQRPPHNEKFYTALCQLKYRYPQLKALAVVVVAVACLGAGLPPMPPVKKKVQRLSTPRGQELYLATPMAIVLPTKVRLLTWEYPLPLPRDAVEFDVETRADLNSPWVKWLSTNQPPVVLNTTAPQMMYRVGAHRKRP